MKETLPHVNADLEKKLYLRRWIITLLYTLSIFAFLPIFPILWNALSQIFPNFLKASAYWLIPGIVITFLTYVIFVLRKKDPLFYAWSGTFLFSYFLLLYFYCEYPGEPFHILEYGLLVILVYWPLKLRMKTARIYLAVLAYTFVIGFLDEIIQGILPNRTYEFKDVLINWISAFLSTGLLMGNTWEGFVGKTTAWKVKKWRLVPIAVMLIFQGAFLYQKYRKPPLNVILLTVDTLRPDHLSCYGYKRNTTPFLDTIAQKGVIFKNVISAAPWTCPAMISLFTGLNPTEHGVQTRNHYLMPGTTTLFKLFKKNGYLVPNISYLTEIVNFSNLGLDPKEPAYFKEAKESGEELLRWLDDHHRSRFVVWYHYRFLHLPYKPRDEYNIYLTDRLRKNLQSRGVMTVQREAVIPHGTIAFTPQEKETIVALYDGQLREFDSFIKRLHERMERWKLNRNTLLMITADHGEELFEHGFIGHASTAIHATMYDEVLKVPLIWYAPSRLKGNKIIRDQVRQIDIMPTLLDLAGLSIPQPIHGVSLMPWIKGKKVRKALPAISESIAGGYQSTPQQERVMLRSIRTGGWKLICKQGDEGEVCQLFNYHKDPGETKDLINKEKERATKMEDELKRHFSRIQSNRLAMLSREKVRFGQTDIPKGARLEKPIILSPKEQEKIPLKEDAQLVLSWTGDEKLTYVIDYDIGKGWRNLKGTIPVQGTRRIFGPLPREAWEPLPYWNPYRIRISPYGLEKYWSDWIEFSIV
ncbi:MAG: VanZ family protein, partial [Pseudomonadota bacterium]